LTGKLHHLKLSVFFKSLQGPQEFKWVHGCLNGRQLLVNFLNIGSTKAKLFLLLNTCIVILPPQRYVSKDEKIQSRNYLQFIPATPSVKEKLLHFHQSFYLCGIVHLAAPLTLHVWKVAVCGAIPYHGTMNLMREKAFK
jgi:hypothetical protein